MKNLKDLWKNQYIRIFIIGFILFTIIVLFWFCYQFHLTEQKKKADQKLINEIRLHYSEFVQTKEDTKLYCKTKNEYQVCGTISKGFSLILEATQIDKTTQQYFRIKDTDYYVFYISLEKIEQFEKEENPYLTWNQVVEIQENSFFYYNDTYIQLSASLSLDLEYQDDMYYYVSYFNHIMKVKKEESALVERQNNEEIEASQVPVLFFEEPNANPEMAQKQVEKLKEKNQYSLSISDYEKWKKGYIRIKDGAVLLLANQESDIDSFHLQDIHQTNFKFIYNNIVSKRDNAEDKISAYQIKKNTSIDDFTKMLAGETIIPPQVPVSSEQKVAVMNYHFFYDPTNGEGCNENICLTTQKFEEQLSYLKQNGYKTLTMEEFRAWMYGEIEIPKKSVLLTIDDGAFGTGKHNGNHLIPILEKYDMHATLFLITGWWDIENYRSPNLDIESHTNDMHTMLSTGAQLLQSSHEQVMNDLKKSIEITKSKTAFCFPFYAYNETAIQQVKNSGFALAFIGGNYKASRSNNKYKIPRYPIYKGTTLEQFINMVS